MSKRSSYLPEGHPKRPKKGGGQQRSRAGGAATATTHLQPHLGLVFFVIIFVVLLVPLVCAAWSAHIDVDARSRGR